MAASDAALAFGALATPHRSFDQPWVLVADDGQTDLHVLREAPLVVIAVSDHCPEWADVIVSAPAQAEPLVAAVEANPAASIVLTQQLRLAEMLPIADGLIAESLAYATLQHGAEFATWLARQGRKVRPPTDEPPVLIDDHGHTVYLTLNRPRLRNALSAEMRDALSEALHPLALRPDTNVVVSGAGRAFCIGGDLAEFGTTTDTALAHRLRMAANAAPAIARVADRCEVRLHGACIGAGIELAAFAGRVVAAENSTISLPEVAMGLLPGAGGTVSIPRRIGRHAAAELMLSGRSIDASEALGLGLVDEVLT